MRQIATNRRGIASTEFALVAPVVFVIFGGFIEYTHVAQARAALESAVMKGARKIAASDCPAEREEQLINLVVRGMQHVKSSDGQPPKIESKSYGSSFGEVGEPEPFVEKPATKNGKYDFGETFTDVNGNGRWDPDMGTSGSVGGANQVVSYTATFRVRSMIPWILKRFGDGNPDYAIKATTVIRNEPVFRTTGCSS